MINPAEKWCQAPFFLLTAKEVSEYLSIPLRTVQRLSKQGKIRAVRMGNKWRYSKDDIVRYRDYGTDFSREPVRRINEQVERRNYPRINCNLRCQYSIVLPPFKDISSSGIIKNISACGVFLIVDGGQIDGDDPVDLEFMDIKAKGRIVRKDNGGFGIKFRDISNEDKDRIIKYVG